MNENATIILTTALFAIGAAILINILATGLVIRSCYGHFSATLPGGLMGAIHDKTTTRKEKGKKSFSSEMVHFYGHEHYRYMARTFTWGLWYVALNTDAAGKMRAIVILPFTKAAKQLDEVYPKIQTFEEYKEKAIRELGENWKDEEENPLT